MADPEIATKAPESDAQEALPTHSASQSATESSPKLGEHCCTDRPTRTSAIVDDKRVVQY